MKKFLVVTPGRTASTSLFAHIRESLYQHGNNVATGDRAAYTKDEMERFNNCEYAAFTLFNPYKFDHIVKEIKPDEWCLVVLTRHDFASWLLSMISIHTTGDWHPGKDKVLDSFSVTQEDLMGAYWYYRCWTKRVEEVADQYNFKKIVRLDFNDLTNDWAAAGKLIGEWNWTPNERLMRKGMTTSWKAVENVDKVLQWIPQDDVKLIEAIKNTI